MLTFDFDRLAIVPEERVLDLGCGTGRHCREALRRGARVTGLDLGREDLRRAREGMAAVLGEDVEPRRAQGGRPGPAPIASVVCGNGLQLPFPDRAFDLVLMAEVLEHIPRDRRAISEAWRVLRAGGRLAVSVPRWFPERICWALSDEYHANPGGHVRVYRGSELGDMLEAAGFRVSGRHHAHALHSPYWWMKCAVGSRRGATALPALYHRFLVWDILRRPRAVRALERALNPLLGKSLVLYLQKPPEGADAA
ncbi:MAG: class I SAM-dependent methyltransferase [Candidatus Dormibacteraceae bacterium]